MELLQGLLAITTLHFIAIASPGPEFILISRQTLAQGKRLGFYCLLGTVLGVMIHVSYSSLGLAKLIMTSPWILLTIKAIGGSYLIYLGLQGISAKPKSQKDQGSHRAGPASSLSVLKSGFLCDLTNPKAPIYYLTLFTVVLSPNMSLFEISIYGAWMIAIHILWFSTVIILLSSPKIHARYQAAGHWFDRFFGTLMITLGSHILITSFS